MTGGLQRALWQELAQQAGPIAEGFRSLFNQPDVTAMLRRVADEERHWQRVLEYCARGSAGVLDGVRHVVDLGVAGRPLPRSSARWARHARGADPTHGAGGGDRSSWTTRQNVKPRREDALPHAVRRSLWRPRAEAQAVQRAGDVQAFNSPSGRLSCNDVRRAGGFHLPPP